MENEELEFDLDTQNNEEINRTNKRIRSLSEKVKLTAEERDELAKAKDELAEAKANAEKERDFYKSFNTLSSKYQGANDFQDKIWEKVKQGYDAEDATVAVLNKEGKFQAPVTPQEKIQAAGGSASISIADTSDKSLDRMSGDEMRAELLALESRGEFRL